MEKIEFLEEAVSLLKDIDRDEEKRKWCRGYNVYQKVRGDRWELEKNLSKFTDDAYESGFVPSDYRATYEQIGEDNIYFEKPQNGVLEKLTDDQIISIIAMQFRNDHFCEGILINRFVAAGIMLPYMLALFQRMKNE